MKLPRATAIIVVAGSILLSLVLFAMAVRPWVSVDARQSFVGVDYQLGVTNQARHQCSPSMSRPYKYANLACHEWKAELSELPAVTSQDLVTQNWMGNNHAFLESGKSRRKYGLVDQLAKHLKKFLQFQSFERMRSPLQAASRVLASSSDPPSSGASDAKQKRGLLQTFLVPLLLANGAKAGLDIISPQGAATQYIYSTAILLRFLVVMMAGIGVLGVVFLLNDTSPGNNDDEGEEKCCDKGNGLEVIVVFLPPMIVQIWFGSKALIQLIWVFFLVRRQRRLYMRMEATVEDLWVAWSTGYDQSSVQQRRRIRRHLKEMTGTQMFYASNYQMLHVREDLLLRDLWKCIQFGRGQQAQLKGTGQSWAWFGINNLRALKTGHRQWTVLQLIENMYEKQGTWGRRDEYHIMGRALKAYSPIQAFLLYNMVPYEALTVLRQLLRIMFVYVGDFDVKYTLDWLDRIHDSTPDEDVPTRRNGTEALNRLLGLPLAEEGVGGLTSRDRQRHISSGARGRRTINRNTRSMTMWQRPTVWNYKRYGRGHDAQAIIREANAKGYNSSDNPSAKQVRSIPGAKRSALDYLIRWDKSQELQDTDSSPSGMTSWLPTDPRWKRFQRVALARRGANSIVASFTPVGRELAKLANRFRHCDGYGWLDNNKNPSTLLGGMDGDAMALADILYWAAESGAFGGTWEASDLQTSSSIEGNANSYLAARRWWHLDSEGDSASLQRYKVAQNTIFARLLMLPTYEIIVSAGSSRCTFPVPLSHGHDTNSRPSLPQRRIWWRGTTSTPVDPLPNDPAEEFDHLELRELLQCGALENRRLAMTGINQMHMAVRALHNALDALDSPRRAAVAITPRASTEYRNGQPFIGSSQPGAECNSQSSHTVLWDTPQSGEDEQFEDDVEGDGSSESAPLRANDAQQDDNRQPSSIYGRLHIGESALNLRPSDPSPVARVPQAQSPYSSCLGIIQDLRKVMQSLSFISNTAGRYVATLEECLSNMKNDVLDDQQDGSSNSWDESQGLEVIKREAGNLERLSDSLKQQVVSAVRRVSRLYGPNARDCLNRCGCRNRFCTERLRRLDGFCKALYRVDRAASQAKMVIHTVCLAAAGADKVDQTTEVVDAHFHDALASLVTCLLVKSRMALVAMLVMSGLWIRLVAQAAAQDDIRSWGVTNWKAYLQQRIFKRSPVAGAPSLAQYGIMDDADGKDTGSNFTADAFTKLLDSYQLLLMNIASEKGFQDTVNLAGGLLRLSLVLQLPSMRAAIVASVACGSELPISLYRSSAATRSLDIFKSLHIEQSSDPLKALSNLGPYPNVDDDVDRVDGWY